MTHREMGDAIRALEPRDMVRAIEVLELIEEHFGGDTEAVHDYADDVLLRFIGDSPPLVEAWQRLNEYV